jgi:two-component system, OmpR family, response regulator
MRILLAEDDFFLANGLCLVLRDSGFAVDHTDNGIEADVALSGTAYDLLVLDLGLPGLDGIEILKKLRQRGNHVPVLILSARDAVRDRVLGLDCGANDYLTKPFDMTELEARIRALLRKGWQNRKSIVLGALEFDTENRTVKVNDQVVELAPRELAVLELLLKSPGTMVPKERLLERLSSWDSEVTTNALDIAVHRLRKKLPEAGFRIRTLRRLGYLIE